MNDTGAWSEEGQELSKRLRVFRVWAWMFLGANVVAFGLYLYMWSVLQREFFFLGSTFLYAANRSWLIPVIAAVPVAFVGLGWISAAFRTMADPSDDEEYSGEKIAFGFVFPGVSFVKPQQILSNLYRKSCSFAGAPHDPAFDARLAFWVASFWGARALDIVRIVARLRMEDYPDFTAVAFSAMGAGALNIVFVLLTIDAFRRILRVQSTVLKDPDLYARLSRERFLGGTPRMDQWVVAAVPAMAETVSDSTVQPQREPLPVRDESNPFALSREQESSYRTGPVGEAGVEGLVWTDILFSSHGRLSRGTYVKYTLFVWGVQALLTLVFGLAASIHAGFFVLFLLAVVPLVFAQFVMQIKRWHDHDKSGWMMLVNLIPVIGPLYSFFKLFLSRGDSGRNSYGCEECDGEVRIDDHARGQMDFYAKL